MHIAGAWPTFHKVLPSTLNKASFQVRNYISSGRSMNLKFLVLIYAISNAKTRISLVTVVTCTGLVISIPALPIQSSEYYYT